MNQNNTAESSNPTEKNSALRVIVHSFFVVPFLIAVFCVLVFVSMRILTTESTTTFDLMEDIRIGGATKRWQAAFELSKRLRAKGVNTQDSRFTSELTRLFEKSIHDDIRVRQYLALAMGQSGNAAFLPVLSGTLKDEKRETVPAVLQAIGLLRAPGGVAALLPYLEDEDPQVRLTAVISLGNIGDPAGIVPLKGRLGDGEPNVRWDASVALAKMGDPSGKSILLKLLDRQYLETFPEIDRQERSQVLIVAIRAAALLNDPALNESIKKLGRQDKNINVQRTVREVLG